MTEEVLANPATMIRCSLDIEYEGDLEVLTQEDVLGKIIAKLHNFFPDYKNRGQVFAFEDEEGDKRLLIGKPRLRLSYDDEENFSEDFCIDVLNIIQEVISDNSLKGNLTVSHTFVTVYEDDNSVKRVFITLNKILISEQHRKIAATDMFSLQLALNSDIESNVMVTSVINKENQKTGFSQYLFCSKENIEFKNLSDYIRKVFDYTKKELFPFLTELYSNIK